MTTMLQKLLTLGLDVDAALSYTGDESTYQFVIEKYVSDYPDKCAELKKFYEESDWPNYIIAAHTLKSSSRMLGATALSKKAEEMELAGKAEDYDSIHAKTAELLTAYAQMVTQLSACISNGDATKAQSQSEGDTVEDIVAAILTALDNFDDASAAKKIVRLMNNVSDDNQKKILNDARQCVEDYEYDEAAKLVKSILG